MEEVRRLGRHLVAHLEVRHPLLGHGAVVVFVYVDHERRAYALAAEGEKGVARMLALMEAEIRVAMALTGCTSMASLDRTALVTATVAR